MDAAHQAMTIEQQQRLNEHMVSLRRQVTEASHATATFLKEIDLAHQTMTTEQRRWLDEQVDGLRRQVGDLRHAAAAFVNELDAANQSMAAEQDQRLARQRAGLAANTAASRADASAAHLAMAQEQDQQLNEHMDHLHSTVEELRRDAAAFLKDLDATHQSMAVELQERLDEQVSELRNNVAAMRDGFRSKQHALQADLSEARQVWRNFNTLKAQKRLKKRFFKPLVTEPPGVEAPTTKQPSLAADDLTAIRGIGSGMAQHLHEAGISTFAQLAASTPDELRRALGKVARLAKVEDWIAQARDLAL
jgi:predicted flap endonuclease-1-like 5' DNA nuclease